MSILDSLIDLAGACLAAIVPRGVIDVPIQFDPGSRIVTANDRSARLNPTEATMLLSIARRRGGLVTRAAIMADTRPDDANDLDDLQHVRVYVHRIRSALAAAGIPDPITNVWGAGYRCCGVEIVGGHSLTLTGPMFLDLPRLIDTHPNKALADRVWTAIDATAA